MKRIATLLAATTLTLVGLTAAPSSAATFGHPTTLTISLEESKGGGVYEIDVTSSRGFTPIVTSTSTPAVCTVNDDDMFALTAGWCTVVADQARTWMFAAGHAERSFWVTP